LEWDVSEFERALQETGHRQKGRGRRIEQKTQQLCRQVQRALNSVLAADDVFVVGVSAAGGCGRLIAHVAVVGDRTVRVVLEELRDRTPRLRTIVAGYISRKRAPELIFVVAPPGGDAHD
jgi:hypothetical protein